MRGASLGGQVGSQGTPFEVRCPRCNVSFPVETRRCIHCGGATAASAAVAGLPVTPGAFEPAAGGVPSPRAPEPIGVGGSDEPDDASAPAPQGVGVTLLKSFGSLFWVIALVAFSFARSCREG
ncbi:hypothetical protein K2X89_13790 [Myxococcota bacterium]|nr:hypothetical protein [Myxococcota bacterium]